MNDPLRSGCVQRRGCLPADSTPIPPTPRRPSTRIRPRTSPTAALGGPPPDAPPTDRAVPTALRWPLWRWRIPRYRSEEEYQRPRASARRARPGRNRWRRLQLWCRSEVPQRRRCRAPLAEPAPRAGRDDGFATADRRSTEVHRQNRQPSRGPAEQRAQREQRVAAKCEVASRGLRALRDRRERYGVDAVTARATP